VTLTIDLVPHLDAGDRKAWPGDQDERPLTELGRRQALALADALGAEPVDALYSGPALRCQQTLAPLAERLGLEVTVLAELGEETWRPPEGWSEGPGGGYVGAFAAGSALAALNRIRAGHPQGRVIVCSHGHTIPTLAAFLAAAYGLEGVPESTQRGQWYRVRRSDAQVRVDLRQAPPGFPT